MGSTRNSKAAAFVFGVVMVSGVVQAQPAVGSEPVCPDEAGLAAKHWVYFNGKGIAPEDVGAALGELERTYDAHALERRRLRRTDVGLFDSRDLPVNEGMIAQVEAAGARVVARSRWLNAVSVEATPEQLAQIAAMETVGGVQPVRAGRRDVLVGPVTQVPRPGPYGSRDVYGLAAEQLSQINLIALHDQGYRGEGVRVAVLDTGFRHDHAVFSTPGFALQLIAEHDFINNDAITANQEGDPGDQHDHGTMILGTLAAYLPDQLIGGAYRASYILCKTENVASETPIEEDFYVAGLEFAEQHGADVATSSLSYTDWYTQSDMDGLTGVTTIAVNIASVNGVHCCTAAGNAGNDEDPATSSIGAPADALQVITCGSVNFEGLLSSFSSDGPTADGRIKPELLARGRSTYTIAPYDTSSFVTASGTSLSTPLVAGAVACLTQVHPEWTPAQMRQALFSTASLAGSPDPLFAMGYGILNASAAAGQVCGTSDFNGDGDFGTDTDIEAFFACLAGSCCATCFHAGADFNSDGDFGTDADIEAFFRVLAGGSC